MLALALASLLAADGGLGGVDRSHGMPIRIKPTAPPLPEQLEMEVDEQRVFRVSGIQRIAVSDTSSHDIKTIGDDLVLIIAVQETRTTLLFWLANGKRLATALHIVPRHTPPPAVPVPGVTHRATRIEGDVPSRGEVEIFEIPEELHDIREGGGVDGGRVFEGTTALGAKRIITVSPRK